MARKMYRSTKAEIIAPPQQPKLTEMQKHFQALNSINHDVSILVTIVQPEINVESRVIENVCDRVLDNAQQCHAMA